MNQALRNLFNTSIQFAHTQINMKKILTIIGTVFVGGSLVAAAVLFNSPDYKAKATDALEQAKAYHEQARDLTCSYIGELTEQCYKKDESACGLLQIAETDYQKEFSQPAYEACFRMPKAGEKLPSGEIAEDKTGIPTQVGDQLFFGDEGKLPK